MRGKYSKSWSIDTMYTDARSTVEQYNEDPEKYVRSFTVQINGKKRNIITYTPDRNGAALRNIHSRFAFTISHCYKSMPDSFAYKKGSGILTCLSQHLQSDTFFKTDIHDYFNSIKFETLLSMFQEDKTCKRRMKKIKALLSLCFYNDHMPIGFITSPVLSDLYLHKVDESFLGRHDVIYTRYADDFIISGKNNMSSLEKAKNELEESLSEYGLSLNAKKTYFRTLHRPGDAIHVLGVNLVNNDPDPNRITVSDRYIRETSKDICRFLSEYQDQTKEENEIALSSAIGKIEFIRFVSPSSYSKLEKMVRIKHGEAVDLSRAMLEGLIKKNNT